MQLHVVASRRYNGCEMTKYRRKRDVDVQSRTIPGLLNLPWSGKGIKRAFDSNPLKDKNKIAGQFKRLKARV